MGENAGLLEIVDAIKRVELWVLEIVGRDGLSGRVGRVERVERVGGIGGAGRVGRW